MCAVRTGYFIQFGQGACDHGRDIYERYTCWEQSEAGGTSNDLKSYVPLEDYQSAPIVEYVMWCAHAEIHAIPQTKSTRYRVQSVKQPPARRLSSG